MTALCGGGTSSAKVGFGASIALTAPGIGALLNNIPTTWAVPLAAYIGLITYDLSTYCSTDPPPVPVIGFADFLAVLSWANPVAHITAVLKFQQLVGAFAWFSLCQCDSVATPAPPAPPAAPASLPNINPTAVIGINPALSACGTYDSGDVTDATPATAVYFGSAFSHGGALPVRGLATAGATQVRATVTWTGNSAPTGWQLVSSTTSSGGDTVRATDATAWTSGVAKQLSFVGLPDPYWYIQVSAQDATTQHFHLVLEFFCGGGPLTPTPNCGCVPDANTIGLLSSIYQLLSSVQRFKVPFAYIQGPTHSAVSGTGATAISRLLGVQLVVTAQPATKRTSLGNPSYIYDLGWVSVSDANGMIEEKRLTRTNLLWFPELAPVANSFNYFLQSGVTINWTELQAET